MGRAIANPRDIVGAKFGTRTVTGYLGQRPDSRDRKWHWYSAICECGCESEATRQTLKKSQKCRLCAHKGPRPHKRIRPYEAAYNGFLVSRSRHDVLMSYEQYAEIAKAKPSCHYCGASLVWTEHRLAGRATGAGHNLDRVDPDGPYSVENCVPCCRPCNIGKNRVFAYDEWVVMAAALVEYRKELEKDG